MNTLSSLYFCFYKNLREWSGVKMKIKREKNFFVVRWMRQGAKNKICNMWIYMYIWWIILYVYVIIMYMSSFLCFCFYENLQELNGVRMRMNGEKDEFLFLDGWERREFCLYLFLWEDVRELTRLVRGWWVSRVDKLKSW